MHMCARGRSRMPLPAALLLVAAAAAAQLPPACENALARMNTTMHQAENSYRVAEKSCLTRCLPPRAAVGKECRSQCGGGDLQPVKDYVSQCEHAAQGKPFFEDFDMVWDAPTGILKTKKKLSTSRALCLPSACPAATWPVIAKMHNTTFCERMSKYPVESCAAKIVEPPMGQPTQGVRAAAVMPSFPLANSAVAGLEFPALGFGSGAYGSNPTCSARPGCMGVGNGCGACAYESMLTWLQMGGRRLDLAYSYDNDLEVARAIRDSGVPRSELFILSKVHLGYEDALAQMEEILRDLETDHVDALLIHWPTRGGSGLDPLCYAGDSVDPAVCRISTWRALLEIFQRGQARSIGVS